MTTPFVPTDGGEGRVAALERWTPPSARERKRLLDEAESIAVVGASSNPARASNFVITYLISSVCDYRIYPVNPGETEVLGLTAYPGLDALPEVPHIVDVFRRDEDCPQVAADAVAVGARVLWLQLGLWNDEAAAIALDGGLEVVMDRCTKIEHARFAGGLHMAGFDTGVISSRRAPTRH
jgi:predicted CoA-binding protein